MPFIFSLVASSGSLQQNTAMAPEASSQSQPSVHFLETLNAVVATGASKWSALGLLYSNLPEEALAHGRQMLGQETTFTLGPSLTELAQVSQTAAQSLLFTALTQFRYGAVNLVDCSWITALPTSMVVSGNLFLMGCSALEELPSEMRVEGVLSLFECSNIQRIPDDLVLERALLIAHCNDFTTLPPGLAINGALSFSYCNSLSALPTGLKVEEELSIQGCPTFESLPLEFQIGGDVEIRDCTSWNGRIPACAKIGGRIITDGHPEGISLADWREAHP